MLHFRTKSMAVRTETLKRTLQNQVQIYHHILTLKEWVGVATVVKVEVVMLGVAMVPKGEVVGVVNLVQAKISCLRDQGKEVVRKLNKEKEIN